MKTKKIITTIVTVLAAGMVILSGIMKFAAPPDMVELLTKFGVAKYMPLFGTMEIGFALLFIFPKTMKIGFILLSCYFSGALATELSHGMPFNALLPLILVWIAAFLRDRSIFLPDTVSTVTTATA